MEVLERNWRNDLEELEGLLAQADLLIERLKATDAPQSQIELLERRSREMREELEAVREAVGS